MPLRLLLMFAFGSDNNNLAYDSTCIFYGQMQQ